MEKEINDLPTFFRKNYKNFKQNDSMAIKIRILDSQRNGELDNDNTPYVPLYFKNNSYKKIQKSKLLNEIIDKQTKEFEKEVNQFFSEMKNVPYIPKME